MNELHAILDAWGELKESDQDAVLATVVHVKGSAYRRPGARMLIMPDGQRIGTISGGCLEGDVSKKAWWFTEDGRPSVRVYDTSSDEDAAWEFGLGCNGVIQVMLERVKAEAGRETRLFLESCRTAGKPGVMATVIRAREGAVPETGDRLFVGPYGVVSGPLHGSAVERGLSFHIEQTLKEKKSRLVHLGSCEVFVEWVGPPVSLVIFGAGHDAIPVVKLAKQLGWHVTVADGRQAYARPGRFPGADRVVLMERENLLQDIAVGAETAVVLMTHNFPQDGKLLREILPARPRYLGVLGPTKRMDQLWAEIGMPADTMAVHAPAGLDIGADSPEAIALSIVAEIQAEFAGRSGMRLRYRSGPIHAPAEEAGAWSGISIPATEQPACELAWAERELKNA
jgi:xanthine dehydrogenase accessory factor